MSCRYRVIVGRNEDEAVNRIDGTRQDRAHRACTPKNDGSLTTEGLPAMGRNQVYSMIFFKWKVALFV